MPDAPGLGAVRPIKVIALRLAPGGFKELLAGYHGISLYRRGLVGWFSRAPHLRHLQMQGWRQGVAICPVEHFGHMSVSGYSSLFVMGLLSDNGQHWRCLWIFDGVKISPAPMHGQPSINQGVPVWVFRDR